MGNTGGKINTHLLIPRRILSVLVWDSLPPRLGLRFLAASPFFSFFCSSQHCVRFIFFYFSLFRFSFFYLWLLLLFSILCSHSTSPSFSCFSPYLSTTLLFPPPYILAVSLSYPHLPLLPTPTYFLFLSFPLRPAVVSYIENAFVLRPQKPNLHCVS